MTRNGKNVLDSHTEVKTLTIPFVWLTEYFLRFKLKKFFRHGFIEITEQKSIYCTLYIHTSTVDIKV